jgi:hypothetical protein
VPRDTIQNATYDYTIFFLILIFLKKIVGVAFGPHGEAGHPQGPNKKDKKKKKKIIFALGVTAGVVRPPQTGQSRGGSLFIFFFNFFF